MTTIGPGDLLIGLMMPLLFVVPVGLILWMVMRLVRAVERIADNSERRGFEQD